MQEVDTMHLSYFYRINYTNFKNIEQKLKRISLSDQMFLETYYANTLTRQEKADVYSLTYKEYYQKHKELLQRLAGEWENGSTKTRKQG